MAARVRVQLNHAGVRALLNAPGTVALLDGMAKRIAERAGSGFIGNAQRGRNRAHGSVVAATHDARMAEATSRVLTQAVGRGGA